MTRLLAIEREDMESVQVDNSIKTSEDQFFSDFEVAASECLRGIKTRSAYCAQNALYHLKKAWMLREVDPQMAAFRAITAEEEAATAVFCVLRERGYNGADRINFRDHLAKQSLYPFVEETLAFLRPGIDFMRAKLRVRRDGGKAVLDILYSLPGCDEAFWSTPPLGIVALPGSVKGLSPEDILGLPRKLTKTMYGISEPFPVNNIKREEMKAGTINLAEALEARLSAKANAAGYEELLRQLKEQVNRRNYLLYASSEGYPESVKEIESVLRARKVRTFKLIYLYCLLFPNDEPSVLVQQALLAFRVVLGYLKLEAIEGSEMYSD